jgi:hypothetical protein
MANHRTSGTQHFELNSPQANQAVRHSRCGTCRRNILLVGLLPADGGGSSRQPLSARRPLPARRPPAGSRRPCTLDDAPAAGGGWRPSRRRGVRGCRSSCQRPLRRSAPCSGGRLLEGARCGGLDSVRVGYRLRRDEKKEKTVPGGGMRRKYHIKPTEVFLYVSASRFLRTKSKHTSAYMIFLAFSYFFRNLFFSILKIN